MIKAHLFAILILLATVIVPSIVRAADEPTASAGQPQSTQVSEETKGSIRKDSTHLKGQQTGEAEDVGQAKRRFVEEKTYDSLHAYKQSAGQTLIDSNSQTLDFFDRTGHVLQRVKLGLDSKGFTRRPLINETGAVVINSKGREELLDIHAHDGRKVATLALPALTYAISSRGIIISAHRTGRTSPSHTYSNLFSIFSSSGGLTSEYRSPLQNPSSAFVFSKSNRYGAIISVRLQRLRELS